MELEILIGKIEQGVAKKISFVEFSEWFEEWFTHDVQQRSCSDELFGLLENLNADIGFYEPNSEIRKEHHLYFGDDVLETKLIELLGNIKG